MGSRSSTRYGPASVFTGPVRKWKKRWIPIPSSSSASAGPSSSSQSSKLSLYRWTSLSNGASGGKDDTADDPSPPPRRRIRYSLVSVLEEKKERLLEKLKRRARVLKLLCHQMRTQIMLIFLWKRLWNLHQSIKKQSS